MLCLDKLQQLDMTEDNRANSLLTVLVNFLFFLNPAFTNHHKINAMDSCVIRRTAMVRGQLPVAF